MGIEEMDLLGHSWGGYLSARYAQRCVEFTTNHSQFIANHGKFTTGGATSARATPKGALNSQRITVNSQPGGLL
eukprot:1177520-Prorocentrum_minimum.AAC.1